MSNSGTCMIKKKCYCSVKRFYLLKQDDRTEDKVKEKLDWSSLVSRGAEERQGTKKLKDRGRKSISSRLLLSFVGFGSFVLFKRITDKMLLVLKKKKKDSEFPLVKCMPSSSFMYENPKPTPRLPQACVSGPSSSTCTSIGLTDQLKNRTLSLKNTGQECTK